MANHTAHRRRTTRRTLAVLASSALVATSIAAVAWTAAPASAAGLSPFDITGRGATVPFVEIEAEEATHTGTKIGPTRYYGQLPAEASGREAVTLDAVGEYVEFTLTKPANAVTFRYSIPDSANGAGRDASIDVRAGSEVKAVPVTSKYGWYYGGYPFNNNPGDINPHHFYDEARTMLGATYPAGTKVRIQVSSTAQSPTFTIDLADFEMVGAPVGKPTNAIDVVADFGANPNGGTVDDTAKFQAAVNAGQARGRPVYVPPGRYNLWSHVVVDRVTLQGAGPWYTVLGGRHPTARNQAVGIYGKYNGQGGPSQNVTVKDLAVIGDIQERVDSDQVNAFGGAMSNSTIDNVWMQHTKVGAWMDGPMDRFTIKNSRILDQTADGVNFHIGVTNSTVTNTFVRNTGDDALAMWAEGVANVNNSFTRNTIGVTLLANHLVSYGGRDITISDNVVADSLTNGGGIHIANRYPGVSGATGVSGTWTVARNTLIRAGNSDYNWNFGVGAIWFSAEKGPWNNPTINITDTDIYDSSYAALHWIEGATTGIRFSNVNIVGAGTYALQVQAPSQVSFNNVRATGIAQANPIHNCVGSGFQITRSGTNTGWYADPPACTGVWPAPQWSNTGSTTNPPTGPTTPPPTDPTTAPPATGNLAQGKPVTVSSANGAYTGSNAVDGNQATYWESSGAFPQTHTVDLGSSQNVGRLVLKLPNGWESRTQNIAVSGSADGSTYSTLIGPAGVTFTPTATINLPSGNRRYLRLTFGSNNVWPAAQLSELEAYAGGGTTPTTTPPTTTPPPAPTGNLATGRPVTATSQADVYGPGNVTDGNANSYWESSTNAFPQSLTVDLGQNRSVSRVVLKLPPAGTWQTRTQTLSVLGSTNGSTYSTVKTSAGYTFNPSSGNTATVTFGATTLRYLRLTFTGNTGWPAGQISELEVHTS